MTQNKEPFTETKNIEETRYKTLTRESEDAEFPYTQDEVPPKIKMEPIQLHVLNLKRASDTECQDVPKCKPN